MKSPRVSIHIAAVVGRASTELAAFDAALVAAGVANFNLVRLSSVIPPNSEVIEVDQCPYTRHGSWGDRLFSVYAEQRTSTPGEQVWAGVGWCQDRESGHGLFVEHEGHSEDEVRGLIDSSLSDMVRSRGIDLGPIHSSVVGATCAGEPTCALVICGYGTDSWSGTTQFACRVQELASA